MPVVWRYYPSLNYPRGILSCKLLWWRCISYNFRLYVYARFLTCRNRPFNLLRDNIICGLRNSKKIYKNYSVYIFIKLNYLLKFLLTILLE